MDGTRVTEMGSSLARCQVAWPVRVGSGTPLGNALGECTLRRLWHQQQHRGRWCASLLCTARGAQYVSHLAKEWRAPVGVRRRIAADVAIMCTTHGDNARRPALCTMRAQHTLYRHRRVATTGAGDLPKSTDSGSAGMMCAVTTCAAVGGVLVVGLAVLPAVSTAARGEAEPPLFSRDC